MKKPMVACALALVSFSLTATAEPLKLGEGESLHIEVPYGDLNLSNAWGARTMMQRITFAATRLCGGTPDIREIRVRSIFKTCVRDAKEGAVHELNAPLVTALLLDELAREEQIASTK